MSMYFRFYITYIIIWPSNCVLKLQCYIKIIVPAFAVYDSTVILIKPLKCDKNTQELFRSLCTIQKKITGVLTLLLFSLAI